MRNEEKKFVVDILEAYIKYTHNTSNIDEKYYQTPCGKLKKDVLEIINTDQDIALAEKDKKALEYVIDLEKQKLDQLLDEINV